MPIGSPFIELRSIDSTNNYAMGMLHEGMAQHGMVVFTTHQTQGRGQRSRSWISTPGENIAMTVILQPSLAGITNVFLLNKAIALAVCNFWNSHTNGDCFVKWPNDIYWRDRKAVGMLIENSFQGTEWTFSVVGIGMNINQTEFEALSNRAVSLKQITGKSWNLTELAKELCLELDQMLLQLRNEPDTIEKHYHQLLYKMGETVKLRQANRVFETRICGVSADGKLMVQHGIEEQFATGEVEWVPDDEK